VRRSAKARRTSTPGLISHQFIGSLQILLYIAAVYRLCYVRADMFPQEALKPNCCDTRQQLADQFAIAARVFPEAVVLFTRRSSTRRPDFERLPQSVWRRRPAQASQFCGWYFFKLSKVCVSFPVSSQSSGIVMPLPGRPPCTSVWTARPQNIRLHRCRPQSSEFCFAGGWLFIRG